MRQRAHRPDGDYSFGSNLPFLVDSPQCVAQAIMTRLKLQAGEWFLDLDEGTHYDGLILGHNTQATRDLEVRGRILETPGVQQISDYISYVDRGRNMTVLATVKTLYGTTDLAATL